MANDTFEAMFKIYPNRNAELKMISAQCYEFGFTIAQEPSAALSSGLDEHAIKRQRSYVDYAIGMVNSLEAKPIPDLPASHPTGFQINLSKPYVMFIEDIGGEKVPLNEQTTLLSQHWMIAAVELASSQSAAMAGSLTTFDHARAINNMGVINKLLDEIESRPILDLPETAQPGSGFGVTGTGN